MMTISSRFREPSLMSPRTIKYVDAVIREGFDYNRWLEEVREEEAQTKRAEARGTSGELGPAAITHAYADEQHGRPNPTPRLLPKIIQVPRALHRPLRQAKSQTRKPRLTRWLEKVRRASGEFQGSRKRDGVYIFLERVFEIVMHYKVRRTNRLLRHAFAFANLPFDGDADAFSVVIRCTSERDIDNKTISKYARALRYASRRKGPDMRLKTFIKKTGGLNACAARYARYYGRCVRQISQG
jgi:hypothetical protein